MKAGRGLLTYVCPLVKDNEGDASRHVRYVQHSIAWCVCGGGGWGDPLQDRERLVACLTAVVDLLIELVRRQMSEDGL